MSISNGPTPYYQQLKHHLRSQIETGDLRAHQQVPSERELCEQFKLSRTTIRQALSEAEREGLIYKVHGKGTFVAARKIDQGLSTISSFEDTIIALGLRPRITVLAVDRLQPDLEINTILNLEMISELTKISLLGYADEEPVVLYETYLAPHIGGPVAEEAINWVEKGLSFSTYQLYHERLGIHPQVTNQIIEVVAADGKTAELLKVKKGTPMFLTTSIVYAENGQPVEYKKAKYRGDKFKFNISRKHVYPDKF